MDKKAFDEKDVVALFERPAGTVIKMVSALAVDIVVELNAVRESHFEKIDEQFERVGLHGAVHEQHCVIVVIEPECVAFDDLDILVSRSPFLRHGSDFRIDLDARDIAVKPAAYQVSDDAPLAATDINERIAARQVKAIEHSVQSEIRR